MNQDSTWPLILELERGEDWEGFFFDTQNKILWSHNVDNPHIELGKKIGTTRPFRKIQDESNKLLTTWMSTTSRRTKWHGRHFLREELLIETRTYSPLFQGGAILALVAILSLSVFAIYVAWACGNLLRLRRSTEEVFTVIEQVLEKRRNLISALLKSPDDYQISVDSQQKLQETFKQAEAARDMHEKSSSEHLLGVAVESLMTKIDPGSNSNWESFKQSYSITENQIDDAKRQYNESARMFNAHVEHFPANMFARIMGLKEMIFLNLP